MIRFSSTVSVGFALAAVAVVFSSCGGASSASGIVITAQDRQAAKAKFETLCYTCHGMTGAGDGPASVGLVPQPRNFQDKAWQASVTDEHIEKIIVQGGAAVGKSVAMPPNPDLRERPAVVAALREHVRGLGADK